jgi:hypothetical protein
MNPYLGGSVGKPVPAMASANGSTSAPTTTSGSFVVIPEMTVTLTIPAGSVKVDFSGCFNMQHNDNWAYAMFVDGVEASGTRRNMQLVMSTGALVSVGDHPAMEASTHHLATGLSAGSHTFDVRWFVTGGAARAVGTQRKLIAIEVI